MKHVPHALFTNLYGPTETTIASSYYTIPRWLADTAAFRAQYSGKGTSKVVRPVPNLGDEAYFDCGQVSARSGDTAVIVGVQKADCHLEMRLAALVREGLAGLPTSSPAG
jgi:hypothetical protein